jgi:hypothetical protein
MVNLRPGRTGLPFVVFISPKGRARHDVRVKVGTPPNFTAAVSVRPEVALMAGELDNSSLLRLAAWIELNRDIIIQHWDGVMATKDAEAAIKNLND